MTRAVTLRRTAFGLLAAGATCAALGLPAASADPTDPVEPVPPATPAVDSTGPVEPVPPATPAVDDCNAASLARTISSVTASLTTYFEAHPDVNQALIDATRQPAFVAVEFEGRGHAVVTEHRQQEAVDRILAFFGERLG